LVKLALAIGEGSELGASRALLGVDQRTSREAFSNLGERVLVYQFADKVLLDFVGSGTVAGINTTSDGFRLVTVDPYAPFGNPIFGETELAMPGARRMLKLDDDRYAEILELAKGSDLTGASEAPARIYDAPSLETYLAIHDQVLRAWDYRCAITGQQFKPGARPHPHLRVVAIRPRELGGPLHVKNYMPMMERAEHAWLTGGIGVTHLGEFVAILDRLDHKLLEAMPLSGKLVMPGDEANWPDSELLAWHFANVFGDV
jgi:hypothetical protein